MKDRRCQRGGRKGCHPFRNFKRIGYWPLRSHPCRAPIAAPAPPRDRSRWPRGRPPPPEPPAPGPRSAISPRSRRCTRWATRTSTPSGAGSIRRSSPSTSPTPCSDNFALLREVSRLRLQLHRRQPLPADEGVLARRLREDGQRTSRRDAGSPPARRWRRATSTRRRPRQSCGRCSTATSTSGRNSGSPARSSCSPTASASRGRCRACWPTPASRASPRRS